MRYSRNVNQNGESEAKTRVGAVCKSCKRKTQERNSIKTRKNTTAVGDTILSSKELTVQLLATEATGSSKKYLRLGPQEFVEFSEVEVTIATLKRACNSHFKDRIPHGMTCEIVASERGPSCTKMTHLKNLNVVHVRFVKSDDDYDDEEEQHDKHTQNNNAGCSASSSNVNSLPAVLRSVPVAKVFKSKRVAIPKSIRVSSMIRLGKAITDFEQAVETIELSDFDIDKMLWSRPRVVKMEIEKEPFASGGFRNAFRGLRQSIFQIYHGFCPL